MLNVLHPLNATHDATNREPLFPATRAQLAHSIVSKLDKSLVDINEVKYHLDLLAVFHKVHHAVQDGGLVVDPSTNSPVISARQALFLCKAQHRFEAWINKVLQRADRYSNSSLSADEIPPVDVLMFLHTYMLNPLIYHEDSIRIYPCLAVMGAFPWKEVHALIDVGKYELIPTPEQISLWESLTSMPFEVPLEMASTELVGITCPRCLSVRDLPWVNSSGTGVGQDFSATCSTCQLTINSDALCVAKFLKDTSSSRPFARTILSHRGSEDLDAAHTISRAIKDILETSNWIQGDHFGWDIANIEAFLLKDVCDNSLKRRIKDILHAYTHPAQSSIDIKAAVMRQARFIAKMHAIQWSGENSSFVGRESALLDAIVRYHQFFVLSSVSVPTLDIDLIFHTHQLSGRDYINDCLNILGAVMDHDDSVPRVDIDDGLSRSANAWENFYNIAYITNIPPLFEAAGGPHGTCNGCIKTDDGKDNKDGGNSGQGGSAGGTGGRSESSGGGGGSGSGSGDGGGIGSGSGGDGGGSGGGGGAGGGGNGGGHGGGHGGDGDLRLCLECRGQRGTHNKGCSKAAK